MKSHWFALSLTLAVGVGSVTVQAQTLTEPLALPKIDRRPAADDYSRLHGKLTQLPAYDPDAQNPFQNDLRSADLSGLDLRESGQKLLCMSFDSRTVWPPVERMSKDFDPSRIMELGKNPGLGIRSLHARGITGRGVSLAIVDQPLIIEHEEFGERIRLYEETNVQPDTPSQLHGPAVASIAAGKTVGVAPESDIYYLAAFAFDTTREDNSKTMNFRWYAQAVRRIVEINRQLPPDKKIRVVSLSIGWHESQAGADEMKQAVAAAKDAGMLVTSSSINTTHGVQINGLGRPPMADPDRFESYVPGMFWAKRLADQRLPKNALLMPMDSRCTAGPTGAKDYAFYRQGGWSWITPYLAGVYALAVQVKPELTPVEFLSLTLRTGHAMNWPGDNTTVPLGVVVDPVAIIDALKAK